MTDQPTPPEHGDLIGYFRNDFRSRYVSIYAHPTDETLVVTCGMPFKGAYEPVWTVESRVNYEAHIGKLQRPLL